MNLSAIALFFFLACSVSAQVRVLDPDDVKLIDAPLPTFAAEAKNYGDEIRVLVDIDVKGKVKAAFVFWPLVPCSKLDDPLVEEIRKAALGAAKKTVFEPVQRDGKAVEERLSLATAFVH